MSEPPIVIDEAFLAQLRWLSNEALVHEALGDLEVDVLDIWRGAIPVQPGLMVEDFGLKAFEPLGGESLGPMRLKILREGPGRSELKNNPQIRNRSEHMNKIDNGVDYDDEKRTEDGT